jgi:hypothetical protein
VSWRELRWLALLASEASGSSTIYDCEKCMGKQSESYRIRWGCRRINPDAVSSDEIILLEKYHYQHCPGTLVDTPYVCSVYELDRIVQSGLSLGNALDLPFPVTDSIMMLNSARNIERSIRERQEKNAS